MPNPKTVKPPAAPQPAGKTVKVSPALSMVGTQPADGIGVITGTAVARGVTSAFIDAIAQHRAWARGPQLAIPA